MRRRSEMESVVTELVAATGADQSDVDWPCPSRYRLDLYPEHLKRDGDSGEHVIAYRPMTEQMVPARSRATLV